MKKFTVCFAFLFSLAAVAQADNLSAPSETGARQPNFIVFLTDDQGWGDLGCYGHPRIKSPNLDQFAKEGMRFTQCYSACSVCSPSRSSILTGRTPYRNGVWRWIPAGSQYHLRESEITVATLLKNNGYDTCHAGKWHLNGKFNSSEQPQPDDHGYDHWLATQNNAAPNHLNPKNFVRNRQAVGMIAGPSSVICAEESIRWLKNRKHKSRPFFLTVWTHEPHLPIESAKEFMRPYADIKDEGLRQHHGNITQLDAAFGKLMKAIDEMGYRENTFVIFTSDNGPEGNGTSGRTRGSTGGLRGRKRHSHEGGIRVPGIVRWPGKVKPGSTSDEPIIGSDIFATICMIAKIEMPKDRIIDGASILPVFAGKKIQRQQPLYWRNHLAPEKYRVAMREGDWKIVGSDDLGSFELYNIKEDRQEKADLSEKHPKKFVELKTKLIEHDRAVLKDGPDWWKNDKPVRRRTVEPKPGKDETGDFDIVLGGIASKTDFGTKLEADAEGLALMKLDSPIDASTTVRIKYRSATTKSRTRNAAIVFGNRPTNKATLKIGSAIGMNQHVAFRGGWNNVGNGRRIKTKLDPTETIEMAIRFDFDKHTATVTVGTETMKVDLGKMKKITWIGLYVKGTASEFSEPKIESSK